MRGRDVLTTIVALAVAAAWLPPTAAAAADTALPAAVATERVSVDLTGGDADGPSLEPSLSRTGRFVAYQSYARDLVESDHDSNVDVFVTDRSTGHTERVSVDASGGGANGWSGGAEVSDGGGVVAFTSSATDLVPEPGFDSTDIYVRDLSTDTTERVSILPDGTPAHVRPGRRPMMSGDGRYVVFATWSDVVYRRDRVTDTTAIVFRRAYAPTVDDDGDRVAFTTPVGIHPDDRNGRADVYVWDEPTGSFLWASPRLAQPAGWPDAYFGVISGDGSAVAFGSRGRDLVSDPPATDRTKDSDLFVRDLTAGTTTQVTVTHDGRDTTYPPLWSYELSADGDVLVFATRDRQIVPGDTGRATDAFAVTLSTGAVQRLSTDASGGDPDGDVTSVAISGDGRVAGFASFAGDLVADDGNGAMDVFVTPVAGATASSVQAHPEVRIGSATVTEGANGAADVSLQVVLSRPSDRPVWVDWATVDGTATAPSDYAAAEGTVGFAVGRVDANIVVRFAGDTVAEGDEAFTVRLTEARGVRIVVADGTVTLLDDEFVRVDVGDVVTDEGSRGQPTVTVPVRLTGPAASEVTAHYETVDGTALAGVDYVAESGTVTIPAGRTSATVDIALVADRAAGVDEAFSVVLSGVQGAVPATATGQVAIRDDDPPSDLGVSVGDVALLEGDAGAKGYARLPVVLSRPAPTDLTVDFATADGTAGAPQDYTGTVGTLTIPAGAVSGGVVVRVVPDAVVEGDETFTVALSSPSAGTVTDGSGVVTIVDEETTPVVAVGDVTVVEGTDGGTSYYPLGRITVVLQRPAAADVVVEWRFVEDTATPGWDYLDYLDERITIPAGARSASIPVETIPDATDVVDEGFDVVVTSPTAEVVDGRGRVTIGNDD